MASEPVDAHVQHSIERTAQWSGLAFRAPPAVPTLIVTLILSMVAGVLVRPGVEGIGIGLAVVGAPAVVAGLVSAPLARSLGGTFYPGRSTFLAAVGTAFMVVAAALSGPLSWWWDVRPAHTLLVAYMVVASFRHSTLFATSDNRHLRTLPVTLVQPALGVAALSEVFAFTPAEGAAALLLFVVFLAPVVFFLHIFDVPLRKNFGVSGSELFRYYLDHLATGDLEGEAILGRFSEGIRAKAGVFAFKRADGSVKAAIVAPAVHPGPIGNLGGSDLPKKLREALPFADVVLVPHGPATHDYNPVSSREVERIGDAVRDAVETMGFEPGGTRPATAGEHVRVTVQGFGGARGGGLLTYTSWPDPIDDVDYGVGHAAELAACLGGMPAATFVDCHNSLVPGSGAVYPCTARADEIIAHAEEAARDAAARRVDALRLGAAEDSQTFTRSQGVGDQGVQALVVEADGATFAYVLWDGNNAVPAVTGAIGKALDGIVDGFQVMTTDNHSVNAVAGAYGPIGHLAPPEHIAEVTRRVVEDALADLEPVESGYARAVVEGLQVFGHQKTVQLTASINVMTSIALELMLATVVIQGLGTVLLFRALGLA